MRKSYAQSTDCSTSAVFLLRAPDYTWTAHISSESPSSNACKLCKVEEYPVSLIYSRLDINGSTLIEEDICHSSDELIHSLNWCGTCQYTILRIWDFAYEHCQNPDLVTLFQESLQNKMDRIASELEEFARESFAECGQTVSLAEKIADADSRSAGRTKGQGRVPQELDLF